MEKKREIDLEKYLDVTRAPGGRQANDGVWIGSCTTTRIYCRTMCPAVGHVNLANVKVFLGAAAAERAGFRPCLTCCPEDMPRPSVERGFSERAVAWDAHVEDLVSGKASVSGDPVTSICKSLDISRSEADEIVKNQFGVTPEEYIATARRLYAKRLLRTTITTAEDVASACGFASADALREEFKSHYRLDVDKLASQKPRRPRLSRQ